MIIFGYPWYLGHGFAGPVHTIDVLNSDNGIHLQATVDHKDLAEREGSDCSWSDQKDPEMYYQTLAPLVHSESPLIQNETCMVK